MKRKPEPPPLGRAPVDISQWEPNSQGSVAASFTQEYVDEHYQCWHCKCNAIFTARDQKHTYEVRKANINQRRILCDSCWHESLNVVKKLETCAEVWGESKMTRRTDKAFLANWLHLLELQETYAPYRHDIARKNMLRKLLAIVD
ncbi:zinc-ribbon domain containing protein [Undibacterium flavidum]|uniref:Zinc-ribbon domain containing protein n=1 Tax=Undibacterium flavidum TaxID=2762297 RepID=A0ABR6YHG2_9BURK|nr:zinc-ribbon domain containing protein [Undibacterium flavidum]